MKTSSLTIVLFCFLCCSSYAQKESLSPNAAALFDAINSRLTASEKNQIATLSGFELNESDKQFYRTTFKEESTTPFNVYVFPLDLTNDGIEEIGIQYSPKSGSGKKGTATILLVKDADGQFKVNVDTPGDFFFINLNNLVFPDLLVNSNAVELPVYRWDGNQYNEHKLMPRSKLKRLKITSLFRASSQYITVSTRE